MYVFDSYSCFQALSTNTWNNIDENATLTKSNMNKNKYLSDQSQVEPFNKQSTHNRKVSFRKCYTCRRSRLWIYLLLAFLLAAMIILLITLPILLTRKSTDECRSNFDSTKLKNRISFVSFVYVSDLLIDMRT